MTEHNNNIDHASRSHALLSASGSERWLNCPGSVIMSKGEQDSTSSFALEGTLAHEIAELWITSKVEAYNLSCNGDSKAIQDLDKNTDIALSKFKDNEHYYDGMLDDVMPYVMRVFDKYVELLASDPFTQIFQEIKLDWTDLYEGGMGTGDAAIVSGDTLYVYDLKFGRGVEVSAVNNTQMMLYSYGNMRALQGMYTINDVEMCIIQPRIHNYSSFTISAGDLNKWAIDTVSPVATDIIESYKLDTMPNGKLKTGDWCRFCKAKYKCSAQLSEFEVIEEASKFENAQYVIDPTRLEDLIIRSTAVIGFIEALNNRLFEELRSGVEYNNFKLVRTAARRYIVDTEALEKELMKKKFRKSDFTETKFIGLTALDKLVGKKRLEEIAGDLIGLKEGNLTIAPKSDKRPDALQSDILNDFKPIN